MAKKKPAAKKPPADDDSIFILSQVEAANLIGKKTHFLNNHNDCPRTRSKQYDARDVIQWYLENLLTERFKL